MTGSRYWEIDFLRGIAIILMVFYHVLFDLHFFYNLDPLFPFANWKFLQVFIGGLFLALVGISSVLKFQKLTSRQERLIFFSFVKRGLLIFFLGMILTMFSIFFIDSGVIVFGILHLIGLSLVIVYPFLKRPKLAMFFSILIVFFSPLLNTLFDKIDFLLPLGGQQFNFSMLDYYPIFPWFAFVLVGVFIGNVLFTDAQRRFPLLKIKTTVFIQFVAYLGRHSLLIYFLHQPIILLFLAFLFR